NLLAEAIEHEVDHTNGTLYIDHLDSMDDLVDLAEEEADTDSDPPVAETTGAPADEVKTPASGSRP
ncbi:MAG: peptide deformylase, partial [Chloroflexi bacterium]|nr:peptide deformylase [Chloroflexota bacterium]